MRLDNSASRIEHDKIDCKSVACSVLRIRHFFLTWLLPLCVAAVLYCIILPDNLFGDEYDEYKFSVLGEPRFGMSTTLDVHTQLARIGYMIVRKDWGIRLYSVICALGSIVLVGKLAGKFLSSRGIILATWIAALSPLLVEFGAEARPNAIFVFSGTLFLYAILVFTENESWSNFFLVAFSVCFGLLSREMFVAVLFFGLAYYVVKRRKFTLKFVFVCLAALLFILRLCYRMATYSNFAPKEVADAPVSVLNLLFRIPMALTFGFCTLKYPERNISFGISITDTIYQNAFSVLLIGVVFLGLLVGFLYYLRKNRKDAYFLAGSIVIPISILIIIQEAGFSILLEKHCAGVIGAYYVLLAAIIMQIVKYKWGKLVVILYCCIIGLSLFHFYFQPEIYSRRSNAIALNEYLQNNLYDMDYVVEYYGPKQSRPNYLTALAKVKNHIVLSDDMPRNATLEEYVQDVNSKCMGRIFLIDSVIMRRMVDPGGCVVSILEKNRHQTLERYGRNLKLHIFTKPTVDDNTVTELLQNL
jgi:hypothetical protein